MAHPLNIISGNIMYYGKLFDFDFVTRGVTVVGSIPTRGTEYAAHGI